jgi:hypothetical protein
MSKQISSQRVRPVYIFHAFLVLAIIVLGLAIIHGSAKPLDKDCTQPGREHEITLEHDTFSTQILTVTQCDQLVIHNKDAHAYMLYFGQHDNHLNYSGYQPNRLLPGDTTTIIATQKGSYHLHDHLQDQANMELTVR